jgi:hypothetical protein
MKKVYIGLIILASSISSSLLEANGQKQKEEMAPWQKRQTTGISQLIHTINKNLGRLEAIFGEVDPDKLSPQVRSYLRDAARSTNKALSLLVQQQLEELDQEEKTAELKTASDTYTENEAS